MWCKPFSISQLAIPAVCVLICFLAYTSQYLFLHFEASRLRTDEIWRINIPVLCAWICYYRSCTVDPGRIPKDWKPSDHKKVDADHDTGRQRWCRKCEAFKPPRAHHCRTCRRLVFPANMKRNTNCLFRCVPKMDHHCPWTSNCVSHSTFPHFIRFLFYDVVALVYLESCLFERVSIIWADRKMPSVRVAPKANRVR